MSKGKRTNSGMTTEWNIVQWNEWTIAQSTGKTNLKNIIKKAIPDSYT